MRVLIPLDGSEFAEAILKHAAQLAKTSPAEVHLLRVVNPLHGTTGKGGPNPGLTYPEPTQLPGSARRSFREGAGAVPVETVGQSAERLRQAATEYLENIAQRFFPDGAIIKVVAGVNPAKEIKDYARRQKVTLMPWPHMGAPAWPSGFWEASPVNSSVPILGQSSWSVPRSSIRADMLPHYYQGCRELNKTKMGSANVP